MMTLHRFLLALVAVGFAFVYVTTFIPALYTLAEIFFVDSLFENGDPKLLAGALAMELTNLLKALFAGLLGTVPTLLILRNKDERPRA